MNTRPLRRLTLADGLILIVAVAVGLGIARIELAMYRRANPPVAVSVFEITLMSISWAALLVMVALIPLRLRRPRPPMRRVRRQPGFIACVAIVFQIACFSLPYAIGVFKQDPVWLTVSVNILYWISSPQSIGGMVATAWTVLALSGRWQPEASWIDRSGRILGIAWIFADIIYLVFHKW